MKLKIQRVHTKKKGFFQIYSPLESMMTEVAQLNWVGQHTTTDTKNNIDFEWVSS
jgi:hypothetical protein